ncbi:hypothetical protein [Neptunicoccus cionae]|uniref:Autotransporter domain-containing protein n=1 Tax=Neptunicoccus cionae TaxID=2035344 RepID=A0A916QV23_9RHOB|nr:hypothetical protein [Amylibacter cionae]GGA10483.1 hypothetical protein GCM10011498_08210 [Amylibacter cionae]
MFLCRKSIAMLCLLYASGSGVVAQSVSSTAFDTVEEAITALGTQTYQTIRASYTETASATFTFAAPSETLTLRYRQDNTSVALRDDNGELISRFDGGTRSESEALLAQFLRERYASDPEALKLTVANTPGDPVAGNPVSLMARMADASFTSGTDVGPSPLTGGSRARGTASYNHLGISLQTGRYSGTGFSANVTSLPLSFAMPLDDPRWAIKINAPLSFSTINGEDYVSGSVGVGLRMPVTDNWAVTPEVRIGALRDSSRGLTTRLANVSLMSNYRVDMRNGYGLVFGNALTYSTSLGSGNSGYDLSNTINKNGVELSGPFQRSLYGLPTSWQFSLVHTKVGGTPTYIDEWTDVSLSLGTIGSKNGVTWDSVRVGLTYTHANRGVRGLNINFGYEF